MGRATTILSIESSCDDTAVAVVQQSDAPEQRIIAHLRQTQIEEHTPFGGVVPELAARAHLSYLPALVENIIKSPALKNTLGNAPFSAIDGIAATAGPGLIGGLLVGVGFAKGLAVSLNKPFIPVNHLEGHALTVRLTESIAFPYLLLLVSGGHCQLVYVQGLGEYTLMGQTLDDAAGEAFDKLAKMLGLGFPGGVAVERCANTHKSNTEYPLTEPLKKQSALDPAMGCNFSFSGVKATCRRLIEQEGDSLDTPALCASFQSIVAKHLASRCDNAIKSLKAEKCSQLVVAGGVAANLHIRHALEKVATAHKYTFHAPPVALCTDNAAMIGWTAIEYMEKYTQACPDSWGNTLKDNLSFAPKPRWPLDSLTP